MHTTNQNEPSASQNDRESDHERSRNNLIEILNLTNIEKEDTSLFLTNIRTIQQIDKNYLKGLPFQTRKIPPIFCNRYKSALLNIKASNINSITFSRIPCNSWTCPACQFHKALRVKYLVRDIIELNDLSYFLTLTLDPKVIPEEFKTENTNNTHKYITKLFNHLITTIKRKEFKYFDTKKNKWKKFNLKETIPLKYVWIIEFQKNGNAHLHILLNQFLPIDIIREVWTLIGGGHIMRVENIKTVKGISMYLTDYIVKGIKNDSTEKSGFKYFERRYSISKSCTRPPKPKTANILKDIPHELKDFYLELIGLKELNAFLIQEEWREKITFDLSENLK